MILENGNKVLVVHRRLFETDVPRFFVGTVDAYEAGLAKVTGYTWMKDQFGGMLIEKDELRTKILALASGTLIIYQLPGGLDLGSLKFESTSDGRLWLSGAGGFRMNLSEKEYRTHVPPRPR